jgi:hypothetical protein
MAGKTMSPTIAAAPAAARVRSAAIETRLCLCIFFLPTLVPSPY